MIRERMQDMNDYESGRYGSHGGGMSPFLMGAITGAAVALLFAPKPGNESRQWLADKARQLRHKAEDEMEGAAGELGYGGGERSRGSHETRSGSGSSMGSPGTTGTGASGQPGTGGTKGPTSTNPLPTSPTGSARVG